MPGAADRRSGDGSAFLGSLLMRPARLTGGRLLQPLDVGQVFETTRRTLVLDQQLTRQNSPRNSGDLDKPSG